MNRTNEIFWAMILFKKGLTILTLFLKDSKEIVR